MKHSHETNLSVVRKVEFEERQVTEVRPVEVERIKIVGDTYILKRLLLTILPVETQSTIMDLFSEKGLEITNALRPFIDNK